VLAEMLGEVGSGACEIVTGAVRDRVKGVVSSVRADRTDQTDRIDQTDRPDQTADVADEHAAAFDPFGTGQADEDATAEAPPATPAAPTPMQRQVGQAVSGRDAAGVTVGRDARQAQLEQAFNGDEWWPGGERRAAVIAQRRAAAEQAAADGDSAAPAKFARRLTPEEGQGNNPGDGLPKDTASDPFTGLRTDIAGGRVSAAQALRLAQRAREVAIHHARPDAGGTARLAQTQLAVEGREGLHPTLTHPGRIPLRQTGGGVEVRVFADTAHGVVYKVYSEGKSGSLGLRLTIDPADGHPVMDTGNDAHIAQKAWVINELGGTPTEIVGYTRQGEVVVKQPLGATDATWQPWAVNREARLVTIPESVLPRHKGMGDLYLSHIDGHDVIVGDLHAGNYIGDTLANGRLTPADLDRAPVLRAWVEENRAAAQALVRRHINYITDVTQSVGPDLASGRACVGGRTGNSRPDTRSGPTILPVA
jgi:hypothetical protein